MANFTVLIRLPGTLTRRVGARAADGTARREVVGRKEIRTQEGYTIITIAVTVEVLPMPLGHARMANKQPFQMVAEILIAQSNMCRLVSNHGSDVGYLRTIVDVK